MVTITDRLERTWETPASVWSWITTVDHKLIGRRYIGTAFTFFILAGLAAVVMRLQLMLPSNDVLGPETYNQFFTMHGTTMIFLVATPILFGFGNFLIPLMLGARDMAFPRLNAMTWWVFVFAGGLMWSSFVHGHDAGCGLVQLRPLVRAGRLSRT